MCSNRVQARAGRTPLSSWGNTIVKGSDGADAAAALEAQREGLAGSPGAVRVRTLLVIRWGAIAGQAATLAMVDQVLHFPLPMSDCIAVTVASILANLYLLFARNAREWIGEREAACHLAFDMAQLTALLYLTGGLENPFAVMILAPVTVSATILSLGSTVLLGLLSAMATTALALVHKQLPWAPVALELPRVYVFGVWVALLSATLFISAYTWRVAAEARGMAQALSATRMALAREQRLSALGALAAAAAHELGSPLGTIAVVARELSRDVEPGSPLQEDIELLMSETARCRDILAQLAETPEAEGDGAPFDMPLSALVEQVAEPYQDLPVPIEIVTEGTPGIEEPLVSQQPELIHGLANFIQNGVQFAATSVTVRVRWGKSDATVLVEDDGPGFSPTILGRLGEPYISTRPGNDGHMGLGVFIASTLLGHTGAVVRFANSERGGALVSIRWKRAAIEVKKTKNDA